MPKSPAARPPIPKLVSRTFAVPVLVTVNTPRRGISDTLGLEEDQGLGVKLMAPAGGGSTVPNPASGMICGLPEALSII